MIDRRKTLFQHLLIALVFMLPALVQAATDTHEFRLANGLKLIVKEDHRAPTVVNMVWYRAGSIDELSCTTCVAHVL
jgi:zinc protease